jgi:hypothetical protein
VGMTAERAEREKRVSVMDQKDYVGGYVRKM